MNVNSNFNLTTGTVFEATISPDDRSTVISGYASSHSVASVMVKGKSWYGSDGRVSDSKETYVFTDVSGEEYVFLKKSRIQVCHTEADIVARNNLKIREAAIAKLTAEEKCVLGLI